MQQSRRYQSCLDPSEGQLVREFLGLSKKNRERPIAEFVGAQQASDIPNGRLEHTE